MKKKALFLSLVLIFCLNFVSYAGNFGATGLITMPTADVLAESRLNLAYQHIFSQPGEDLITTSYGIRKGVQVGGQITWNQEAGVGFQPTLKANLLSEQGAYQPLLSAGVKGRDDNLYLVASKMIPEYGFRVHLGVGEEKIFKDHVGLGVSKILNPVVISSGESGFQVPHINLQAEYNGGLNLGTELRFGSGIKADLSLIDLDRAAVSIGFENKF